MSQSEESARNRKQNINNATSVLYFSMAVVYIGVGLYVLIFNPVVELGNTFRYIFGAACVLYGLFRVYRGLQLRKRMED